MESTQSEDAEVPSVSELFENYTTVRRRVNEMESDPNVDKKQLEKAKAKLQRLFAALPDIGY